MMIERYCRRHILTALCSGFVASCANVRRGSAFFGTITGDHPGGGAADTRAYAERLPYASMLYWLEGHSRDLVVLGSFDPDDRLTWYTADKKAISTFGPFIVATSDDGVELRRTDFGPGWSPDLRQLVGKTLDRVTIVARGGLTKAHLRSRFHAAGTEMVKILGTASSFQRIDEFVVANGRTSFLNNYWIDSAGACFKSRQHALPTVQPINIEVLKYPART